MPAPYEPGPAATVEWTLREDVRQGQGKPSAQILAGAFGLLAAGFVFLLDLSFSVDQFKLTLTPRFVAFTIFYVAVGRIQSPGAKDDWLAPLLLVLAIVSGMAFLADLFGAAVFANQNLVVLTAGFDLLFALATLAVVWRLCGMIRDFALQHDHPGLARMAHHRRVIYLAYGVVVHLVMVPLLLFALQTPLNFLFMWALMFIAGLVVIGLLVHLALFARQAATDMETGVDLPPYPGLSENV